MAYTSYNISTKQSTISGTVHITGTSNGAKANSSTVTVTLTLWRNNTYYGTPTSMTGTNYYSIYINGIECGKPNGVYGTWTIPNNNGTGAYLQFAEVTNANVPHNADGTKTVTVEVAMSNNVGHNAFTISTQSGSLVLDTIPRAPSYNSISSSSVTETSVYLSSSIDTKGLSITDGGWDLSTDWGATWTYYSGNPTGKTISGLSPNTQYWYRCYAVTAGGSSNSSWGTFKTYAYPYINSAPNFNIGNQLTIGIYNPLGRTCKVYIINQAGTQKGGDQTVGTSIGPAYNNSGWQTYWYSSIVAPTNTSQYKVRLVVSALGRDTTVNGGYMTAVSSECAPVFSANVTDVNSTTLALTNDATKIISGYSTARITPSLTRASSTYDTNTAITKYTALSTDFTTTLDITGATTNQYSVVATNARTFTNTVTTTGATIHPYFKPTIINAKFERPMATSDDMNLSFNGTSFNQCFDSANTNYNALNIKWYVRKNEEDNWTDGGTLTLGTDYTINTTDNTYQSVSGLQIDNPFSGETSWDYMQKYYFKFEISDVLSQTILEQYVTIGIPVYDWYTDSNKVNHFEINGELVVTDKITLPNRLKQTLLFSNTPGSGSVGTLSAAGSNYTLTGGKKFNDYDLILIIFGTRVWGWNNKQDFLFPMEGWGESSMSTGNLMCSVMSIYNTDTIGHMQYYITNNNKITVYRNSHSSGDNHIYIRYIFGINIFG